MAKQSAPTDPLATARAALAAAESRLEAARHKHTAAAAAAETAERTVAELLAERDESLRGFGERELPAVTAQLRQARLAQEDSAGATEVLAGLVREAEAAVLAAEQVADEVLQGAWQARYASLRTELVEYLREKVPPYWASTMRAGCFRWALGELLSDLARADALAGLRDTLEALPPPDGLEPARSSLLDQGVRDALKASQS